MISKEFVFFQDGRDSSGSRLLLPRIQGSDPDLDVGATVLLDNHAALHKLSVKPRRTHAVPLNRRVQQVTTVVSLPTTPEDTENMVVPGNFLLQLPLDII